MQITHFTRTLFVILLLAGCAATSATPTSAPTSAPTPTPAPLSIEETYWRDTSFAAFDAVHSPIDGDEHASLIFGNLQAAAPGADVPSDLAAFLGRWEGYDYGSPVSKDTKIVFFVQEITAQGGKALLWAGTNLQYPTDVKEIQFRVAPGDDPVIEWQAEFPSGGKTITVTVHGMIDPASHLLRGSIDLPSGQSAGGPFELSRGRSFVVYRNYTKYLADKRIYPKDFLNPDLRHYGRGYLVYLPEGYEDNPEQAWPLLIFLHGSGERGDNLLLMVKASPFMMIREKGPLPCLIVAPILQYSNEYRSFPQEYMDGMLEEIQAQYRVDPGRIYLTGLSMGGEAAYRFALHQPDTFAALAPLAAFDARYFPGAVQEGFVPSTEPPEQIADLPVWAIHGADDHIVPLSVAQNTVEALQKAGVNVRFTVLENHDHDVWTDTYSDPQFYEWLFQQQRR